MMVIDRDEGTEKDTRDLKDEMFIRSSKCVSIARVEQNTSLVSSRKQFVQEWEELRD